MALDIRKGTHVVSFPSKVASAMGQYGHIFNTVITDAVDNGALCAKGDYVSFDQYEQAALEAGDTITGEILDQDANGCWFVEFKSLPADKVVLYLYGSPVSEYSERELQAESLWFNAEDEVVQGMMLMETDVAEYSADAFTGDPVKGATVTYDVATNKWTI